MKKNRLTLKYKIYNERHSRKLSTRKEYWKDFKRKKNQKSTGKPKRERKKENLFEKDFWSYKTIKAPIQFSLIYNTQETIEFFNTIVELQKTKKKVFIKLDEVNQIDYSAIVALLAIMIDFKTKKIGFNGNFPKNQESNILLVKSGFFQNLLIPFKEEKRYSIISPNGEGIHTHAFKDVDSKLSSEIIKSATEKIWGESRRCQGVQRVLIELMQNTKDHSNNNIDNGKHWWLSYNYDEKRKIVSFSFIDFGVGIFESLENKPMKDKFYGWLNKLIGRFNNNADLLKLILNGEFHQTVTGEKFRGKGLPGIAKAVERNQISNLHIITNNVRCDFSNSTYELLKNSFSGTHIYWELNSSNHSNSL